VELNFELLAKGPSMALSYKKPILKRLKRVLILSKIASFLSKLALQQ